MPDQMTVPAEPDAPRRLETCTRGFSDRFGDRLLTFDRGTATPLELLRFKPELSASSAFESGLRDRVERTQVQSLAVAPARSVERWDGALVLVSRHAAGRRLSEALAEGRGAAVALDFLRQITPALAALADANGRFGHGALSLDRVVVSHDGRLTLVEHPLGTAVESLGWPVARLQSELGLAVPPADVPMGFDSRIDPIQLAFVTLSVMLGRRVDAAEYPKGISKLLDESAEAKGGDSWAASRLRTWLERALQTGPRPFENAGEALGSIGELPIDMDVMRPADPPAPPTPVVQVTMPKPVAVLHGGMPLPKPVPAPAPAPPPPPVAVPAAAARVPVAAKPVAPPVMQVVQATPAVAHPPEPVVPPPAAKTARRSSVLPWAFAAVSIVAIVEGAVLTGQWYFAPPPAPAPSVAESAPTAAAEAPIGPASAKPAVVLMANAPGAAASAPAATPAAEPAPVASATPRFGGMTFVSPLELQVFEGGKRIGASGGPIAMVEGVHSVELVNEALGFRARETVTVRPGEMVSRTIAVPNGRLSINATPWADVWIDGSSAGQTPLANLSIAIGEHQITFRHPQLGEQRQTALVKSEGVTRLSVAFQR